MIGVMLFLDTASAGIRCVEVHKVFRVGVPADVVYSLVVDAGGEVSDLTCLSEPMADALEHYDLDTTGAALPASIQANLDALTKQPNELICGAFSCGEQSDIVSNASVMSRAYADAAYRCSVHAACDAYDYAYLIDAEISYDGVVEAFGDNSVMPTCAEFTSAMIPAEWLSFTDCRPVGEEVTPTCTEASACTTTPRPICPSQKAYVLDSYHEPGVSQLSKKCNKDTTCTPPEVCFSDGVLQSDIHNIETPTP